MAALLPGAGLALDLPANARMTAERMSEAGSYVVPISPFDNGGFQSITIDGIVRQQAWRIPSPGLTPLQVLSPLRDQLVAAGYEIILDCADRVCGGFDFRFQTEVLPAPNMYVNISDYRFLTAASGEPQTPDAVVTLMISNTRDAAYVQVIEARRAGQALSEIRTETPPIAPAVVPTLPTEGDIKDLITEGHVVLEGIEFASGGKALGTDKVPALARLAAYLQENPGLKIAIVGHTDSVGGLDGNIALSRERARSVRQRLIETYGIAADRLEAEGMGYLAPRGSNLTDAGRAANRRVEAVVLKNE